MRVQLRSPGVPLPTRRPLASLTPPPHPDDSRGDTDAEPRRSAPSRGAPRDDIDHTSPKIRRIRLSHVSPRSLLKTETRISGRNCESPDELGILENALSSAAGSPATLSPCRARAYPDRIKLRPARQWTGPPLTRAIIRAAASAGVNDVCLVGHRPGRHHHATPNHMWGTGVAKRSSGGPDLGAVHCAPGAQLADCAGKMFEPKPCVADPLWTMRRAMPSPIDLQGAPTCRPRPTS